MKSKLSLNADGTFLVSNVTDLSYTSFPLCNTLSMKSSIGPNLGGDAKIDQNSFLLLPTSVEDLANSLLKRSVFFRVNDEFTWSITGQTPKQILTPDQVDMYGDFLVHKIVRSNKLFSCEIESFVPSNDTYQELHKITVKNTGEEALSLKSVVGVPIYGRSAENIRDHRHVTALLSRVTLFDHGVVNKPTFSFDERGHVINERNYGVFANHSHHQSVKTFFPTLEEFVGEGHTLLDPIVVKKDVKNTHKVGDTIGGYEAMAGLEYDDVVLEQGEEMTIVLSLAIEDNVEKMLEIVSGLNPSSFDVLKEETKGYWSKELSTLDFHFPSGEYNGWLKWVKIQPIFRRIYGNSFMPHHDYGRGGRGWRDLWQDLLALILMDPSNVHEMIKNHFKGVRIDGSNATIIGDKPGEFLADRNNIARVWMDHGSWPLLTTKLYLDQSGDTNLLFEEVGYFADQFTHYTKRVNKNYKSKTNTLKTKDGQEAVGTILEHILVQNVVPYYNVGEHNNIRLEDADWNDGLDMAHHRGESVAFTSFYGQNLITLSEMLRKLREQGVHQISLFEEFDELLKDVNQEDIAHKNQLLQYYFGLVEDGVSGEKSVYDTLVLEKILYKKGFELLEQVRLNEWLEDGEDGWFNGYYDDASVALDNIEQKRMTLTGQVFSIMSKAATNEQVEKVIESADRYLYKKEIGGYILNTDFDEVKTNMGRLFGFAYGHKENGAMFSHMAVMYANALYKRGFVVAGHKVLDSIYQQSINIKSSKMYPGIPEYFDPRGRGMYPYLTGSASWLILTLVTEVFGVKGDLGMAVFEPKILLSEFDDQQEIKIETLVCGKKMTVVYENKSSLDYGKYEIGSVLVDGKKALFTKTKFGVKMNQRVKGKEVRIGLKEKKDKTESRLF